MDSDDAVSIAAAFNLRDGDGGGGTSGHSRYQRGAVATPFGRLLAAPRYDTRNGDGGSAATAGAVPAAVWSPFRESGAWHGPLEARTAAEQRRPITTDSVAARCTSCARPKIRRTGPR